MVTHLGLLDSPMHKIQKAPKKTVTSMIKGLHDVDSDIEGKISEGSCSYSVNFVRSPSVEGSEC